MSDTPLDFEKVEALRKHMLLTGRDMAVLLGVSRVTYYSWVAGKPIRPKNAAMVRALLRKLITVVSGYGWPTHEILSASQPERLARLQRLLAELN